LAINRTKLSVYVYFGQLSLAFNLPFLLVNAEVDTPLPCFEYEWEAACELDWTLARAKTPPAHASFLESFDSLFETQSNVTFSWSPFGALVMLHAMLQEIWQLRRSARGSILPSQLQPLEYALHKWECTWEASPGSLMPQGLPQILSLSANILLKLAYCRLYGGYPTPKPGLLSLDQDIVCDRVTQFIKHVPRSPGSSIAAYHAVRALLMPLTAGLEWLQKNMAGACSLHSYFLCSMQCCQSSWELYPYYSETKLLTMYIGLYLRKWLETVTATDKAGWTADEQRIVALAKAALEEIGVDADLIHAPIHVQLIHGWCSLFKNPGQWGFAPHFVQAMRWYADTLLG
jgi:hypothetical protein